MPQKKRLVIANWKMHPGTLAAARKLFSGVARKVSRIRSSKVVICPPMLYLPDLVSRYSGSAVSFGAQDCSRERDEGSFTGEISPLMLKRFGVQYVILGHSERRALGEDDELVAGKVRAALSVGLTTVLCVGEKERDDEGAYLQWLEQQLLGSLKGVPRSAASKLIVAYEPIWAIGKKAADAMTPDELHHMALFIRKVLVKQYGRNIGGGVKILYGGSVEPGNDAALMDGTMVDGFLVGHASLKADEFVDVVR